MKRPNKEAEKWEKIANAMFRALQKAKPEGLNMPLLIMDALSGRTDDMIAVLDEYTKKAN